MENKQKIIINEFINNFEKFNFNWKTTEEQKTELNNLRNLLELEKTVEYIEGKVLNILFKSFITYGRNKEEVKIYTIDIENGGYKGNDWFYYLGTVNNKPYYIQQDELFNIIMKIILKNKKLDIDFDLWIETSKL